MLCKYYFLLSIAYNCQCRVCLKGPLTQSFLFIILVVHYSITLSSSFSGSCICHYIACYPHHTWPSIHGHSCCVCFYYNSVTFKIWWCFQVEDWGITDFGVLKKMKTSVVVSLFSGREQEREINSMLQTMRVSARATTVVNLWTFSSFKCSRNFLIITLKLRGNWNISFSSFNIFILKQKRTVQKCLQRNMKLFHKQPTLLCVKMEQSSSHKYRIAQRNILVFTGQ